MKKSLYLLFAVVSLAASGCVNRTSLAYQNEPQCMGVDQNGKQRILVFGIGRNYSDARYQAKKNAVAAVIFDGIKGGSEGCNTKPLIFEPNAREKYEDFFNRFFSPEGRPYDRFVDYRKTRNCSADKTAGQHTYKIGVVLYVDRPALKQYLKEQGIIKE